METVRLKKKMALADAFSALGRSCVAQMEANMAGVQARDAESLHQMRVALRRLRALLKMFEPLVTAPQNIQKGLDWLAAALGPVRDWDVLAGTTLKRVRGADTSALSETALAKAAKLHRAMLRTLDSPRFKKLMLRLNSWMQEKQWRNDVTEAGRVAMKKQAARSAIPLLKKAEKRLRKRIALLEPREAPAVHRVRIAAKKARYGAEFFRDLLDREKAANYIHKLSALQDRLGMLNDMTVAARLLAELQYENSQLAQAAAFSLGYLSAEAEAGLEQLEKPLKAVAKLRMT
ncbi:CHAD domain-containing protein [Pseudoduganella aquatica]|uniref:CHAD domain-containing protein n=1 Tax=Pseudoduganella aquatica TaxID=2660641 RepID=UPI001E3DBC26|nr:CHAD domain-containing protein [Pseudoduganella aquatica]